MGDESFLPQRRSIRLKGFDYSKPSAYFLTICTRDKDQLFGKVVDDRMTVNALGKSVNECWLAIPEHFANVELATHVVMPNHVHGIIVIRHEATRRPLQEEAPANGASGESGAKVERRAQHAVPLPRGRAGSQEHGRNYVTLHAGSIAAIVRSFKSASTKRVRKILHKPRFAVWQRGYYEHVIRDLDDFRSTSEYIRTNPARWSFAEENK